MTNRLEILPGMILRPQWLDAAEQKVLLAEVLSLTETAPFYRPVMPRTGKPFSVEESSLGTLGWVSDAQGYRYERLHPVTGMPWPAIPERLNALWNELTGYRALPETCLLNLYRDGARMGLHQDLDEEARDAPVVSISLGDDARFRIGGQTRGGPTRPLTLKSGDVLVFGGPSRLVFHGVDRVFAGTSTLLPEGGRLNLTLRRVTRPPE